MDNLVIINHDSGYRFRDLNLSNVCRCCKWFSGQPSFLQKYSDLDFFFIDEINKLRINEIRIF